jgi:hypothetical protein
MEYSEYLFANLLSVYDDDFKKKSYDYQYNLVPQLHLDFLNSEFNDPSKQEYDCMCNYLDADMHKTSYVAHEIVEQIFDMKVCDSINPEIWALVSKRILATIDVPEQNVDKIEEAKKTLKDAGFYTDNLWSINDVKWEHGCDDKTAYDVLGKALTNQCTMEQIWLSIELAMEKYEK